MRIGIVGAGAIGGWVAGALCERGGIVSVFARGATRDALRAQGLRVQLAGGERKSRLAAVSDDAAELGPQDLVILAVKGPSLAAVAPAVRAMLAPATIVLTLMNGVPWWFFADRDGARIDAVDPDGAIAEAIPVAHVIGGVVHASCSVAAPGVIVHHRGTGLIIGEPRGDQSERVERVRGLLAGAGFDVTVSSRIQKDIWYKLWGNMTVNPISALTGAWSDAILGDDLVRGFVLAIMAEAKETGRRIGCAIEESGEARLDVTRRLGAFKTSMLQDAEAGRALELDALLAAPREIAASVGVATPAMDALLGLARLYGRTRGLYA
jgi:2-dehydropantoate 2-reductase